jgi:hypothetical protein
MQAAEDIVEDIVNYWNGLESKTITLTIKEVREGGSSGSSGGSGTGTGSSGTGTGSGSGSGSSSDSTSSTSGSAGGGPTIADITPAEMGTQSQKDISSSSQAFMESGIGVAGYVSKLESKEIAAAAKTAIADGAKASLMAAKTVGVVSSTNKLTTTADTAAKKITSSVADTAKNLQKAGSLVGTTSSSAGEANKFKNLASSSNQKPATTNKPAVNTNTLAGILAASNPKPTTASILQNNRIKLASGGMVPKTKYLRMGGMLPYKSEGGSIFKPLGTDTVPAMLTPGEFVVRKYAVDNFGVDRLSAINSGTYSGESVYNYNLNVNVKSDANPNEIAQTVMTQIRQVDSMRLRGNRF